MSVEPRGPPFGRLEFEADFDFACLRELMRKRGVGAPQRGMSGCGWRVTSRGRAAMARLSGVSGCGGRVTSWERGATARGRGVSGCGCRVTSWERSALARGTPRQRRETH
jgi:hypothetical protein